MKERQLRLAFFLCIACPAMQAVSRPHPIKKFCEAQQSIDRSGRELLLKGKEKNQSIKKATTKKCL